MLNEDVCFKHLEDRWAEVNCQVMGGGSSLFRRGSLLVEQGAAIGLHLVEAFEEVGIINLQLVHSVQSAAQLHRENTFIQT